MEQLSISSFLQNGHSFHLYVYDHVDGIPEGTVVKDANAVVSARRIFKYADHDSYAGFANLFRYQLLLQHGGYWVDRDVVCLKPFRFQTEHLFACVRTSRSFLGLRAKYHAGNWLIKAPVDSAIMEYCYNEAARRDPGELKWGETGPRLLRTAIDRFGMHDDIAAKDTFCPIYYEEWQRFVDGSLIASIKWRTAMRRSAAAHLYNEMWRRNSVDKNASFPPNSIYERLKQRYLDVT